jgi:hypothetical protein
MAFFKVLYELHARMYIETGVPYIGCLLAIALGTLSQVNGVTAGTGSSELMT